MWRKYRRATKLIPELKDMTYTERLKKLKLPSLAHRRRSGDMLQTFKIIKGIEDIPSERFFKLCTSSSTHGHIVSNWRNPVEQHYDYSSFQREL